MNLVLAASPRSMQCWGITANKDWLARNQDNVSEWSNKFTCWLLFRWASPTKRVGPVQGKHHNHFIARKTFTHDTSICSFCLNSNAQVSLIASPVVVVHYVVVRLLLTEFMPSDLFAIHKCVTYFLFNVLPLYCFCLSWL
jgi:hypothetical protein